jgi:hypothetical protein
MLSHGEFKKEIVSMYKELNLSCDETKYGLIKKIDKHIGEDALESASYMFPQASGKYKGRKLEIAPSHYPFLISDVALEGDIDDAMLGQLNPSLLVKAEISDSSYDYLVISMKMDADIGPSSVMIYPKNLWSKIGALLMLRWDTNTGYKEFDDKYSVSVGARRWFFRTLDKGIMRSIIELDLPNDRGAIFQFSKSHATFSILPRAIGKEKLMKAMDVLERIVGNIESKNRR